MKESRSNTQNDTAALRFFLLPGREAILRMRPVLVELSTLCGQAGAMDYLEYFLTRRENIKKVPYLVLIASVPHDDVSQLKAEDLTGAVLVYEYKLLGLPLGMFSTSDFNGIRAVIAPANVRAAVSAMACRYLIENSARVVLLSLSGIPEGDQASYQTIPDSERRLLWTSQVREVGASLILEDTLDQTLAHLGSHTRRNLRYYRRRAEAELGCVLVSEVRGTLTKAQLMELNRASTHPVAKAVLEHRYAALQNLNGGFCVGVQSSSGEWISLMAGRRHNNITEIDWQINRGGLAKYSIGTVIRSFLIENEVKLGMKRLFFEGGTPHSLRHSFLSETAVDIIAARPSMAVSLLRRATTLLRIRNNYLVQVMVNPDLRWEMH